MHSVTGLDSIYDGPDSINTKHKPTLPNLPKFRRGIYETFYGNAAYVSGPSAKTAWDTDAGMRVPISEVTATRLRDADDSDERG